jgi:hypothetical protein
MSLDTYANLQAEIALWLNRTDLTAQIPGFITLAEAQMNRRLRAFQMLSRSSFPISGELTALPSDFLAVETLRNTTSGLVLRSVSPRMMDDDRATYDYAAGDPQRYSIEGVNLRVSPVPGAAVATSLLYYAALPALASNTSNWLLALYPDAYLYGALTQSAPYLRADERLATWSTLFLAAMADINEKSSGFGGALDMQPNTYGAGAI